MLNSLNIHLSLETFRNNSTGQSGPRVMVVGPPDVGKSSLAKVLVNYAVRSGRQPIFVDLDVEQVKFSYFLFLINFHFFFSKKMIESYFSPRYN